MSISSATAVEHLRAELSPSSVVETKDSERYEESIKRWATSAEKPAGIIVFPTSAEDVSKTVLFCTAQNIELAICGGGHSTSGSSSTDGGLCVDLSKMRGVSVDPVKRTITAFGGARWADVNTAAEKHGLATVGGTIDDTGIGGLTLGGGYGYLTGKFGLVIDNLLSVELVLADGKVITASDVENQDLFWAVKGAGMSFGVATSFTYKAHEQKNPIWGGMLVFPRTELTNVVNFANTVFDVSNRDALILMGFCAPPPMLVPAVLTVLFYNGEEKEAKSFFKPLLDLNPLTNMTSSMAYAAVNAMLNDSMQAGIRRLMKGSAFLNPLDPTYAAGIFEDFVAFVEKVPDAGQTMVLWEFVNYHKLLEVPQEATAFANRGAYGNVLFAPGWTKPAHDSEIREWTRSMAVKARAELERTKALGADKVTHEAVGEYSNYDSLNATAKTLFGVNYPRLATLKKKYDPGNVFGRGPNLII